MLSKKNVFKLEKRRKIYQFIDKNPGLNIREISRRLNIPFTSLLHHLKYLKKLDLMREKQEGKYKKIFISDKISTIDKQVLSLLRNENSCKILLYLFFMLSCSQAELSKELDMPPSTISYYLKKMKDMEIIEESTVIDGRIYPFPKGVRYIEHKPIRSEKFYRRKNQQVVNSFFKLLIAHKSSLGNQAFLDDFIDCWMAYRADRQATNTKINKFIKLDDQINNFANLLDKYFRPPFCA